MSAALHPYWLPLQQAMQQAADETVAAGAAAYMKHISAFYGVKSPVRRDLLKVFHAGQGLPSIAELDIIIRSAWAQPQREFHYCAMETLHKMRNKTGEDAIVLYEWMICNKSWWDSIDFIAPNLVGNHFKRFPNLRDISVENWMLSGNFWLQRCCLLFQLKYKAETNENLLFALASDLAHEKEFFIRKAIGWALREYAKTNPVAVSNFVEKTELSGLSRREALKHISQKA